MSIDEDINWTKMWEEELLFQTDEIECESQDIWDQFLNDSDVELDISECNYDKNNGDLIFVFSETGGQNESDNSGWSRSYSITFCEHDLCMKSITYEQG